MVNGIRNRRRNTGDPDFTQAARSYRTEYEIGMLHETNIDIRHVGIYRNGIIGKVVGYDAAVLMVIYGVLEQRHADSHGDSTHGLAARCFEVHDAADIEDG